LKLLFESTPRISYRIGRLHDCFQNSDRICSHFRSSVQKLSASKVLVGLLVDGGVVDLCNNLFGGEMIDFLVNEPTTVTAAAALLVAKAGLAHVPLVLTASLARHARLFLISITVISAARYSHLPWILTTAPARHAASLVAGAVGVAACAVVTLLIIQTSARLLPAIA